MKALEPNGGLFCGNFSFRRGPFALCHKAWCGPYYSYQGLKPLPVKPLIDEEGAEIVNVSREDDYLVARNGDHLIPSSVICAFFGTFNTKTSRRVTRLMTKSWISFGEQI